MGSLSSAKMLYAEEKEQGGQSLFSLFAYSSVGNPLDAMSAIQRQFFFSSMFRVLQMQSAENEQRVHDLSGKMLPPISTASLSVITFRIGEKLRQAAIKEAQENEAGQKTATRKAARAARLAAEEEVRNLLQEMYCQKFEEINSGSGGSGQVPSYKLAGGKGMRQEGGIGAAVLHQQEESGGVLPDLPLGARRDEVIEQDKGELLRRIVFKEKSPEVMKAQQGLAAILDDYARGNAEKAQEVLSEFAYRLSSQDYKAEDLAAVLLLVIEDQIWAGEEGGVVSGKPGGAASRVQALIPEKIRQTAAESAEIRLASVREMLRYYFMKHPEDLRGALVIALGLSEAEAEDDAVLRTKMSAAIGEMGAFALSQKVLAAIKKMKEMDTKKCLFELGYKYDKDKRKLIIGKRTCGKPVEARGIVSLLLSKYKKPTSG